MKAVKAIKALIIEASTERGIVGITIGEEIIFEQHLPVGFQQSKHLMPTIVEAFKEVGMEAKQLDYIGVGIGPGSYTSIRLCAAIAKALAYGCELPLIGFCSLKAFLPRDLGTFGALIDAKVGGAYLLKGVKNQGVIYLNEPIVVPLEHIGEHLKDCEQLVTPNSKILSGKLDTLYPDNHWKFSEGSPNLVHLSQIVNTKYLKREWSIDTHLDLLYLRKTEAEYNKLNGIK